ncbi:MAG: 30S ribosomal protein S7 [Candidatus Cloacimonetes bacterium]|jgi:small subunit ribosomal protein S7|nr:30S ribosomal protein S7 [Candidatus Syntrophosphaera sp.]NLA44861.1 30S ribosomal protein S7 [Candidatus Cloacimonadota bacterium]HOJ41592.1 30S ribosomal protein S7 [Candidatus Syntrophosphaera thermopropionivorans]HOL33518.1 30S ribosomal protein S7 [Candidatus Syntrophosphaera thermopropionivorans]HON32271.1 30S ribosomal protein S7 [Candidatus Syntrophosphaera thermopropionivorans]
MPRKKKAVVREVLPDPIYQDVVLSKFINCVMKKGKKSIAEKIVYGAFNIIEEKTKQPPLEVFKTAINNVRPQLKVVSRRVGGSNYQIPMEVSEKNGQALAFRWIITYARARNEKSMDEKLAAELIAASKNEGASIKKREDTHKMAEANKAFAHLRF